VVVKRLTGPEPVRHIYAAVRRTRAQEVVTVAAVKALVAAAKSLSSR
jgi:hypothetical protein